MKTYLWFGLVLWSRIVSFSSCQIAITTFDLPSVQNMEENFNASIEFSVDLSGQDQSDIFQLVKTFRGTPHAITKKTADMLMLKRRAQATSLADGQSSTNRASTANQYVQIMLKKSEETPGLLRQQ